MLGPIVGSFDESTGERLGGGGGGGSLVWVTFQPEDIQGAIVEFWAGTVEKELFVAEIVEARPFVGLAECELTAVFVVFELVAPVAEEAGLEFEGELEVSISDLKPEMDEEAGERAGATLGDRMPGLPEEICKLVRMVV